MDTKILLITIFFYIKLAINFPIKLNLFNENEINKFLETLKNNVTKIIINNSEFDDDNTNDYKNLLKEWSKNYAIPNEIKCLNNGVFINNKCICPKEFTGDSCEKRIFDNKETKEIKFDCDKNEFECLNNGKCIEELEVTTMDILQEKIIKKVCICRLGFTGRRCETRKLECSDFETSPCSPNEICVSETDKMECIPKSQYKTMT